MKYDLIDRTPMGQNKDIPIKQAIDQTVWSVPWWAWVLLGVMACITAHHSIRFQ